MNRQQHMMQVNQATIDVMVSDTMLDAQRHELEALHLRNAPSAEIESARARLHDQLDIMLDALSRQKHHLRMAMKAEY